MQCFADRPSLEWWRGELQPDAVCTWAVRGRSRHSSSPALFHKRRRRRGTSSVGSGGTYPPDWTGNGSRSLRGSGKPLESTAVRPRGGCYRGKTVPVGRPRWPRTLCWARDLHRSRHQPVCWRRGPVGLVAPAREPRHVDHPSYSSFYRATLCQHGICCPHVSVCLYVTSQYCTKVANLGSRNNATR